eukprot:3829718-Pyramimonas_sp.AAC.1
MPPLLCPSCLPQAQQLLGRSPTSGTPSGSAAASSGGTSGSSASGACSGHGEGLEGGGDSRPSRGSSRSDVAVKLENGLRPARDASSQQLQDDDDAESILLSQEDGLDDLTTPKNQ